MPCLCTAMRRASEGCAKIVGELCKFWPFPRLELATSKSVSWRFLPKKRSLLLRSSKWLVSICNFKSFWCFWSFRRESSWVEISLEFLVRTSLLSHESQSFFRQVWENKKLGTRMLFRNCQKLCIKAPGSSSSNRATGISGCASKIQCLKKRFIWSDCLMRHRMQNRSGRIIRIMIPAGVCGPGGCRAFACRNQTSAFWCVTVPEFFKRRFANLLFTGPL